jgi:hypothetical protein
MGEIPAAMSGDRPKVKATVARAICRRVLPKAYRAFCAVPRWNGRSWSLVSRHLSDGVFFIASANWRHRRRCHLFAGSSNHPDLGLLSGRQEKAERGQTYQRVETACVMHREGPWFFERVSIACSASRKRKGAEPYGSPVEENVLGVAGSIIRLI